MKKLAVVLVSLILALTVAGCSDNADNAFSGIDTETTNNLIKFLESAALGGSGSYEVIVDGNLGLGFVGDAQGSVSGKPDNAVIVSYSFLDSNIIEVGRTEVGPDGEWGPVTVLYGPKALVLMEENKITGYWITPQVYAMAPFTTEPEFFVSPRDSGLVALALIHSGKPQAAANLLAGIRVAHVEGKGLPIRADVFGRPQIEGMNPEATAWAGYAAAVLAGSTRSNNLWEEAKDYGLYLRDTEVPDNNEARLAGWLLFSELAGKYPEFGDLPDLWQPEVGTQYDPIVGTWMLLSGEGDLGSYIISSFEPESSSQKWIHYNLLAAVKQLPEELDLADIAVISDGKAVFAGKRASLEATSWMVLALSGKIR